MLLDGRWGKRNGVATKRFGKGMARMFRVVLHGLQRIPAHTTHHLLAREILIRAWIDWTTHPSRKIREDAFHWLFSPTQTFPDSYPFSPTTIYGVLGVNPYTLKKQAVVGLRMGEGRFFQDELSHYLRELESILGR